MLPSGHGGSRSVTWSGTARSASLGDPLLEPVGRHEPLLHEGIGVHGTLGLLGVVGLEGDQPAGAVPEGPTQVVRELELVPVGDMPGDHGADTVGVVPHEVEVRVPGTQTASSFLQPGSCAGGPSVSRSSARVDRSCMPATAAATRRGVALPTSDVGTSYRSSATLIARRLRSSLRRMIGTSTGSSNRKAPCGRSSTRTTRRLPPGVMDT